MNNNAQFAEFSTNSSAPLITQTVNKVTETTNLDESQHVAWGAFQAGMQVLQNYAGRSPANLESMAKANLQLLHRSLLNDPNYVQSIKEASYKIPSRISNNTPGNVSNNVLKNSLPSSQCVFDNNILRADLLTLQSGTTIPLESHQGSCAMYLSISGKPSIRSADMTQPQSKHWWDRYHQSRCGASLKNEGAVFLASHNMNKKLLTAEKKECILLRIQLQTVEVNSAA